MADRPATFTNPIPGVAVGDPFVLAHRGWFYLYGTNDGPPLADGRVVPVHRSDDLLRWEFLGGALEPSDPGAEHWAPEVFPWNGRFFMVVSFGDVERRGHQLWGAVADRPEGPFRLETRISTPGEVFSIDGSYLLDDDGRLYLYRCLDFIDEPPYGTGIVVQPMADPLTPAGEPRTVLRAHSPWQVFLPDRAMPLYGGRTFSEWTTIEGPAPVKRHGRYFCGYSGGNYQLAYGTGEAVAEAPLGPYLDLRGREGPIFGTIPGLVEGPGHFSVIRPDGVHDWIVLHGRTPGDSARRPWLCPATWDPDGVSIGALTTDPQPAPPLPTLRWRREAGFEFDGPPLSWLASEGHVEPVPDGFRLVGGPSSMPVAKPIQRGRDVHWSGDWLAEVFVRFPSATGTAALIATTRSLPEVTRVLLHAGESTCEVPDAGPAAALPSLGGDAFDPTRFHRLEVRARGGSAEVRVDGVLLFRDVALPRDSVWIGLGAGGDDGVIFDGLAITGRPVLPTG